MLTADTGRCNKSFMNQKHGLVDIIPDPSKANLKTVQDVNPCFLK